MLGKDTARGVADAMGGRLFLTMVYLLLIGLGAVVGFLVAGPSGAAVAAGVSLLAWPIIWHVGAPIFAVFYGLWVLFRPNKHR